MIKKTTTENGYVALISAILISVSLLILVSVVSFEGFFSRFTIFETDQKEVASYLAEACVQTAILKISQDVNYHLSATFPETITVGTNNCEIVSIAQGIFPNRRVIETQGQLGDAFTNLEVEINVENNPTIVTTNWTEVGSH